MNQKPSSFEQTQMIMTSEVKCSTLNNNDLDKRGKKGNAVVTNEPFYVHLTQEQCVG